MKLRMTIMIIALMCTRAVFANNIQLYQGIQKDGSTCNVSVTYNENYAVELVEITGKYSITEPRVVINALTKLTALAFAAGAIVVIPFVEEDFNDWKSLMRQVWNEEEEFYSDKTSFQNGILSAVPLEKADNKDKNFSYASLIKDSSNNIVEALISSSSENQHKYIYCNKINPL